MYFCLLLVATGLLTLVSIPFLHCVVPLSSFGSEVSPTPVVFGGLPCLLFQCEALPIYVCVTLLLTLCL